MCCYGPAHTGCDSCICFAFTVTDIGSFDFLFVPFIVIRTYHFSWIFALD